MSETENIASIQAAAERAVELAGKRDQQLRQLVADACEHVIDWDVVKKIAIDAGFTSDEVYDLMPLFDEYMAVHHLTPLQKTTWVERDN